MIQFRSGLKLPVFGSFFEIFSSWQRYRAFIKEEVPDEGLKGKTDYDYYQGFDFGLSWEIKLIKSSLHRNINPSNGISIWSLVNLKGNFS